MLRGENKENDVSILTDHELFYDFAGVCGLHRENR